MLTTIDNPYDPWTEYDKWLQFDHEKGYYTQELLARAAQVDLDESDEITEKIINLAMIELVENDLRQILMIKNKN